MFFLITSGGGGGIGLELPIHRTYMKVNNKGESGTCLACYRDQPHVKLDHFKDL